LLATSDFPDSVIVLLVQAVYVCLFCSILPLAQKNLFLDVYYPTAGSKCQGFVLTTLGYRESKQCDVVRSTGSYP